MVDAGLTDPRSHRQDAASLLWLRLACPLVALLTVAAAGCAAKAPPVVAAAPRHPDFMFPNTPDGTPLPLAGRIDLGWRFLQADDLRNASREFAAALKDRPSFVPAETAMGYVEMARKAADDARARFDRALQVDGAYVPALVGRGQALLELGREADALASFEAALARDPSLVDLRGRVEVFRFRATQALLAQAKRSADAGRWDEARSAYLQAIAASPDSAFLYRELAVVELKAGRPGPALDYYRTAVRLDPGDARSHAAIGTILEEQDDVIGALAAYERAREIDATEVPDAVLARVRGRAAFAKLPPLYRAIPTLPAVTRAEVAALVGIRLEAIVARARPRQLVITDIRSQWAERWITAVVRAGIMDTLANYEFQPALRVRRGELALVVFRLLGLIAADKPEAGKTWRAARVPVRDVPPGHLSYPSVSAAVASGVMLLSGGAFDLLRPVTGAEAVDVMGRLEALARP